MRHDVDLEAIRRFVGDGRPRGDPTTVEAIAWGECPACTPRYVAGFAGLAGEEPVPGERAAALAMVPRRAGRGGRVGGALRCRCCSTAWDLDGSSWSACAGSGLEATGSRKALHEGEHLDGAGVEVEPIDPGCVASALHLAVADFDATTGRLVRDDLVDDVAESLLAVYLRKADERAELARIAIEHELDDDLARAWRTMALDALAVVRSLTSEVAPPRRRPAGPVAPAPPPADAPLPDPLSDDAPASDPTSADAPLTDPLSGDAPASDPPGGAEQPPRRRLELSRERFEQLLADVLDALHPDLVRKLDN
ncbi:MAG TPA: hypothetical protein VMD59_07420, partial [Acidimicrobiales bacterium]|nr:hypothetical protein [Acidimicrobiales bacterium]